MNRVDLSACHGCSLCVLVCPVWQQTRDIALTPKYCVRALQSGAEPDDLRLAAQACILCGACNAACPRGIDLYHMMKSLRAHVYQSTQQDSRHGSYSDDDSNDNRNDKRHTHSDSAALKPIVVDQLFIPSPTLQRHPDLLQCIVELLNTQRSTQCAADIGLDIIQALALGLEIQSDRMDEFLAPLSKVKTIIVDNGLLYRFLRNELPHSHIISLGVALGKLDRDLGLSTSDLYVINTRVYHASYTVLRPYYDQLRTSSGCRMNLDLQRIAQPTLAAFDNDLLDNALQVQHILQGLEIKRIIVEDIEDMQEFQQAKGVQVLHLAELIANE